MVIINFQTISVLLNYNFVVANYGYRNKNSYSLSI